MSIADSSDSSTKAGMVEWIGHVHFDNGAVKEVSVLGVHRNDKTKALLDVCHAAGITSPNSPGVKGVILSLADNSQPARMYGARMRSTAAPEKPSNVVELRPAMRKYRVNVYPTTYAAYTISQTIETTSSVAALEAVLKLVNVDSMMKAGDYIVQELVPGNPPRTVLKKGNISANEVGVNKLPVAAALPAAVVSRTTLVGEQLYQPTHHTIVRKESN